MTKPWDGKGYRELMAKMTARQDPIPAKYKACPWEYHDLMHKAAEQGPQVKPKKQLGLFEDE